MEVSVTVKEFLRRVDAGEKLLLLDVRNADEAAAWSIDSARPVDAVQVPYFDFIEDGEAAVAKVPKDPSRGPVLVLCAKGGSSEFVAELLRTEGYEALNIEGGMEAYGAHLEATRIPLRQDERGFEVWQLNRRGKGCLSYVIRAGEDAVVVDPSRNVAFYEDFVRGLGARIVRVLDTHVHADHLSGGPQLAARTGAGFFVTAGEGMTLKLPVTPLLDGELLRLGGGEGDAGVTVQARILATPGHTPGSTSYLVGDRYLLSGDTLFVQGVGRPDLGGQVEAWGRALFHTLNDRLRHLPDDTVVLPAHYGCRSELGPQGVVWTSLGALRRRAPEFAIRDEEAFVAAMRKGVKPAPAVYESIVKANLGLLSPTPEEAVTWELGKNECAASAGQAH